MRFATYPSLEKRVVVVTGGATGIGAAIVRGFAANHARVAFVDVQAEPARALAASLCDEGLPSPLFVECDLLDVSAIFAAIDHIGETLGPVHGLVNNAA